MEKLLSFHCCSNSHKLAGLGQPKLFKSSKVQDKSPWATIKLEGGWEWSGLRSLWKL